jgi:hypothetical protein
MAEKRQSSATIFDDIACQTLFSLLFLRNFPVIREETSYGSTASRTTFLTLFRTDSAAGWLAAATGWRRSGGFRASAW